MKGLFIGARVRILYSPGWPELAGQEGRIVGAGTISKGVNAGAEGWLVAPDCWGTPRAPYRGTCGANRFCPLSEQLEPILPEGAEPSQFSYEELMDNLLTQVQEELA